MPPADPTLLRAIADAIARTFVGDPAAAKVIADAALAWVEDHRDRVGDAPVPWLAAATVEHALEAAPSPDHPYQRAREVLAEEMSSQPVSVRVAVALVGMCGFDRVAAAQLTRRRVEELDHLLAPFADILEDLVVLRGVADTAPPPPPPAPLPAPLGEPTTAETAGEGARAAPHEPPPPPRRRDRRLLPISAGTALTILMIIALVVATTVPHGERPSFAEPAAPASTQADRSDCTTMGTLDSRTLDVGAEMRPARLTLPPGHTNGAPLILLVGDAAQSAEDAVTTTGLETAGTTQGFAVLTLDGTAQPWNVTAAADRGDDIAMAADAIEQAGDSGCVDTTRTVVVGYGTGAHLAAAIACSGNDRIAALVMVRGAYAPPSCSLKRSIPVLIETDTTDAILPFDGGWGISAVKDPTYEPGGSEATFLAWAKLNGCDDSQVDERDDQGVEVRTRGSCKDTVSVSWRVTVGFGHAWPPDVVRATLALATAVA